jgi:hypothetical protein
MRSFSMGHPVLIISIVMFAVPAVVIVGWTVKA